MSEILEPGLISFLVVDMALSYFGLAATSHTLVMRNIVVKEEININK